jgi:hypothetical protein
MTRSETASGRSPTRTRNCATRLTILNQYTKTYESSPNSPIEQFAYDLDGNLTNDGRFAYTWDAENRLKRVTPIDSPVGTKRVEFDYDYLGRRCRKRIYERAASHWNLLVQDRRFVYDGWNIIMELDGLNMGGTGDPPVIRKYTWGLDLSGLNGNPSVAGIHGAGGIGGLLPLSSRWGRWRRSRSRA